MTFKQILTTAVIAGGIGLSSGSAWAASSTDIVGKWATKNNKSQIQIYKKGSKFFGKIVWLKVPKANGKPKMDTKNPNVKLRKRKLAGLNLLSGFSYSKGTWTGGTIYNPEDGKSYSCNMKLKNKQTLEVRGYVLNPLLGKTQLWRRVKK